MLARRKGRSTHSGQGGQGDDGWAWIPREGGGGSVNSGHWHHTTGGVMSKGGRPLGNTLFVSRWSGAPTVRLGRAGVRYFRAPRVHGSWCLA